MNKNTLLAVFTAVAAFVVSLPFLGAGIDLEDACYHLWRARSIYQGECPLPLTSAISYYLFGWWMSFSPVPNMLWWSYLGGSVLTSTALYFAVMIYCLLFKTRRWIDVVVCLAFTLMSHGFNRCQIDYYAFPITLSVVFFYLWMTYDVAGHNRLRLFTLGIFGGVIAFERITFIPLVLFPVIWWVGGWLLKKDQRVTRRIIAYFFSALLVWFLLRVVFISYLPQESLQVVEANFNRADALIRMKTALVSIYKLCDSILPRAIGVLVIISAISKIHSKKIEQMIIWAICGCICIYLGIVFVRTLLQPDVVYSYHGNAVFGQYSKFLLVLVMMFMGIVPFVDFNDVREISCQGYRLYLLPMVVFSLFIIPLGSDVFLQKITKFFIAVGLPFLGVAFRMCRDKRWHIVRYLAAMLILIGIVARLTTGYRNPAVINCCTESTIPELRHMRSSEKRIRVLDQTFAKIRKEVPPRATVLYVSRCHYAPLALLGLTEWNKVDYKRGVFVQRFEAARRARKALPEFAIVDATLIESEPTIMTCLSQYEKIFSSDDLENGPEQNFHYSLWRLRNSQKATHATIRSN